MAEDAKQVTLTSPEDGHEIYAQHEGEGDAKQLVLQHDHGFTERIVLAAESSKRRLEHLFRKHPELKELDPAFQAHQAAQDGPPTQEAPSGAEAAQEPVNQQFG